MTYPHTAKGLQIASSLGMVTGGSDALARPVRTAIVLLPMLSPLMHGQSFSFGVVAGTNLTDDVRSGRAEFVSIASSQTYIVDGGGRRPIIGLKLEQTLTRSWALEFNALHREWKSISTTLISPPIELSDRNTLSMLGPFTRTLTTWEFPLLVKHRFRLPGWRPYLAAGPSFRPAGTGTGLSHAGITAGGGVEFETSGFRLTPGFRYTRWLPGNYSDIGKPLANQVEFLVAVDRPSTAAGVSAFGRRLSVGVIAGVGLGRDYRPSAFEFDRSTPESNSGIYGVLVEAGLTRNLSVEANGLYRPLHGWHDESGRPVRFAHLTWEFPVLLKYRLAGSRRWLPFIEGGPAFRAEGNLNLRPVSHYGATVGGGVQTKVAWLKIAPMVRYTRWGDSGGAAFARTWANQTQLLLGFAL